MKSKEPLSLQSILKGGPSSLLTRLARQQSDNNTLLERIKALLASHFGQHLLAATYREEVLVLVADSPAWANRIRFENANLRKKLLDNKLFSLEKENSDNLPVLKKIVVRTAAGEIG